jgi:hypothetical protein
MEPVRAKITIGKAGVATVIPLDHDGRPTPRSAPAVNGVIDIDTARDNTPYYLVRYK